MASKRRIRRVGARKCSGKRTYRSLGAAWAVALHRLAEAMEADVRPYRCPYCRHYHLGHDMKPRKTSYEDRGQRVARQSGAAV